MAYRNFSFEDIERKFGIKQDRKKLFDAASIKPEKPSDWLVETLERNKISPKSTEKAASELVISPILLEVVFKNQDLVTLFSGEDLPADRSMGLNGEVDFIILQASKAMELKAPIVNVTEAKLNKALEKSAAQAAAQMVGARVFNQKHGSEVEFIFGAVTDGSSWLFLKLENDSLFVDIEEYSSVNLPQLLGIWQSIINIYAKKNNPPAS